MHSKLPHTGRSRCHCFTYIIPVYYFVKLLSLSLNSQTNYDILAICNQYFELNLRWKETRAIQIMFDIVVLMVSY